MTKVFKIAYFVGEEGESWFVLKVGKERYHITPLAAAGGVMGVIEELGFDPFGGASKASGGGYSITSTILREARRNRGMARNGRSRRWVSLYKRKGGWGGARARSDVDIDRAMWENLVDEAARIHSYEPLLKLGTLAESPKIRKRFVKDVIERQNAHEEQ